MLLRRHTSGFLWLPAPLVLVAFGHTVPLALGLAHRYGNADIENHKGQLVHQRPFSGSRHGLCSHFHLYARHQRDQYQRLHRERLPHGHLLLDLPPQNGENGSFYDLPVQGYGRSSSGFDPRILTIPRWFPLCRCRRCLWRRSLFIYELFPLYD